MRVYHAPPSIGSRLPGVVKPSYGKPKLKLESNPLKLTGDSRNFGFNPLGPADTDAKSPYRRTHAVVVMMAQSRELKKLNRYARKVGQKVAEQLPRLIKP